MKIDIKYLDSNFNLDFESVFVLEVINKSYFYRIVNDFNNISSSIGSDNICIYNASLDVESMEGKIITLIDCFNLNSKRYNLPLQKLLGRSFPEENLKKINLSLHKILKEINLVINNSDLPIIIDKNYSIDNIIKSLDFNVFREGSLFENVLLLIEIESILRLNKIIVFVDIKKYLTDSELIELYKYSLYKQVMILLIESIYNSNNIKYEKKMRIDSDLTEIML